MTEAPIEQARRYFAEGDPVSGLASVKAACADAGSPQTIRDAFNLLQAALSAAAAEARGPEQDFSPLPPRAMASIVIATRDRTHLLGDALESIARQDYADWEAVVVNDGGELVDQVIAASAAATRTRLIDLPAGKGQAGARNVGIAAARGEIICFLDDDDRFLPGHLVQLAAALQGSAAAYCGCETVIERLEDGRRIELARRKAYMPAAYSHELLRVRNYMPPCTFAVRTECLRQANGFDEALRFMEDWDLLLRIAARWHFAQAGTVGAEYRLREPHVADSVSKRSGNAAGMIQTIYARHPGEDSELVHFARKLYVWLISTGNFSPPAGAPSA